MPKFATGKKAKAISDRSGMAFPYVEMVFEWNGSFVHNSEFEAKAPQVQPGPHPADAVALQNVRTDRTETAVPQLLGVNAFKTGSASSSTITVTERSHGRSTSDTVRFRGPIFTTSDPDAFQNPKNFDGITGSNISKAAGYSITVGKRDSSGNITNTTDFYHFTVDTDTATSGGVSGGGNNCSAGPATLTA